MKQEFTKEQIEMTLLGWFHMAEQSHLDAIGCSDPKRADDLYKITEYRMRMALETLKALTKTIGVAGRVNPLTARRDSI